MMKYGAVVLLVLACAACSNQDSVGPIVEKTTVHPTPNQVVTTTNPVVAWGAEVTCIIKSEDLLLCKTKEGRAFKVEYDKSGMGFHPYCTFNGLAFTLVKE